MGGVGTVAGWDRGCWSAGMALRGFYAPSLSARHVS